MNGPEVTAVVDLQFGSTGKGSIAAWLGEYGEFDAVTTAWGPNAGHTSVYADGTECVRTMLSNAAFRSPTIKQVFIAPGSMVNPDSLAAEIADNYARGNTEVNLEILIHESAAVVLDVDRANEARYGFQIGSTMKGTGEAVMRKMRRVADGDWPATMGEFCRKYPEHPVSRLVCNHKVYISALYGCRNLLVEGCQGYSLGINSGFWPHCTSRECSLPQLLSDTLLPIHSVADVIGTLRTYPIRVANRYNAQGEMIGSSGGVYFDQDEISWAMIGREPELTTVTKLPRRVFTFSKMQVEEAMRRNSVNSLFVNFVNYFETPAHEVEFFDELQGCLTPGQSVSFKGYGPKITDIKPIGPWAEIKAEVDRERSA